MRTLGFKVLSAFVVLAFLAPIFLIPIAAAQVQEKCQWERVEYLVNAEIKVTDGQLTLVYKATNYVFSLPDYAYALAEEQADRQKKLLQTQESSILVPTEEGPVAVPVEEFWVGVINGRIVLLAEENPQWVVPIMVAITICPTVSPPPPPPCETLVTQGEYCGYLGGSPEKVTRVIAFDHEVAPAGTSFMYFNAEPPWWTLEGHDRIRGWAWTETNWQPFSKVAVVNSHLWFWNRIIGQWMKVDSERRSQAGTFPTIKANAFTEYMLCRLCACDPRTCPRNPQWWGITSQHQVFLMGSRIHSESDSAVRLLDPP